MYGIFAKLLEFILILNPNHFPPYILRVWLHARTREHESSVIQSFKCFETLAPSPTRTQPPLYPLHPPPFFLKRGTLMSLWIGEHTFHFLCFRILHKYFAVFRALSQDHDNSSLSVSIAKAKIMKWKELSNSNSKQNRYMSIYYRDKISLAKNRHFVTYWIK